MLFEREDKKPIENVSDKQLRRQLGYKRGGDDTFAILSESNGGYVQMLGGGVACCLEWRDIEGGKHYRAYQEPPCVTWKEDTKLGRILLQPREFFRIAQVTDAFVAFLKNHPFPAYIKWRDITEELVAIGIERPRPNKKTSLAG